MKLTWTLCLLSLTAFGQEPAPLPDMQEPSNRAIAERVIRHVAEAVPGQKLGSVAADHHAVEGRLGALRVQVMLGRSAEQASKLGSILISVAPDATIEYKGRKVARWGGWDHVAFSEGKISITITGPKGIDPAVIQRMIDAAVEEAAKIRF
jgi:hypothetical protein